MFNIYIYDYYIHVTEFICKLCLCHCTLYVALLMFFCVWTPFIHLHIFYILLFGTISATELTGASLICGDWKPSPKCKKLWSTTSCLQTTDHFSTAAKTFSLTISIKKTEVLCQVAPGTTQPEPSIKIDGTALKNVEGFTCLGSCLSSFGSLVTEISCRLSKASSALGCLWTWIWHKHGITQETKLAVYRAVVLPTLLYGCKTWTCYCRHL